MAQSPATFCSAELASMQAWFTLVGDEHGVDSGGVEARLVASLEEIALADSAVDKHSLACCSVFDDGGVAFASACEHM